MLCAGRMHQAGSNHIGRLHAGDVSVLAARLPRLQAVGQRKRRCYHCAVLDAGGGAETVRTRCPRQPGGSCVVQAAAWVAVLHSALALQSRLEVSTTYRIYLKAKSYPPISIYYYFITKI